MGGLALVNRRDRRMTVLGGIGRGGSLRLLGVCDGIDPMIEASLFDGREKVRPIVY